MRIFYLMIGFISVGLALLGVALPLLPPPFFAVGDCMLFTLFQTSYTILSCIKSMWRTFAKQVLLFGSVKEKFLFPFIF